MNSYRSSIEDPIVYGRGAIIGETTNPNQLYTFSHPSWKTPQGERIVVKEYPSIGGLREGQPTSIEELLRPISKGSLKPGTEEIPGLAPRTNEEHLLPDAKDDMEIDIQQPSPTNEDELVEIKEDTPEAYLARVEAMRTLEHAKTLFWTPRASEPSSTLCYLGGGSGQWIVDILPASTLLLAWTEKFVYMSHHPKTPGFSYTDSAYQRRQSERHTLGFLLNRPDGVGLDANNPPLNRKFDNKKDEAMMKGAKIVFITPTKKVRLHPDWVSANSPRFKEKLDAIKAQIHQDITIDETFTPNYLNYLEPQTSEQKVKVALEWRQGEEALRVIIVDRRKGSLGGHPFKVTVPRASKLLPNPSHEKWYSDGL